MTNEQQIVGPYTARRIGTTGCEIIDPDGEVIAWTVDDHWAGIITALLNGLERDGLAAQLEMGPHSPRHK